MKLRFLTMIFALIIFGAPITVGAQSVVIHRVAILTPQIWVNYKDFREALSSLGYREGANLTLDLRSAEGQLARLPSMATELVGKHPDVIVALNTPGTRAAMAATRTIPIVMTEVGDPVGTGFVSNLARPEGNVTGMSNLCGELAGKRLSLLKEAVPSARRIGVLLNPGDPITIPQIKEIERVAPSIGVEIRLFPIHAVAEVGSIFDQMLKWGPDAALWLCGQQGAMEQRTVEMAAKRRLPLMCFRRETVRGGGGLMSYNTDTAILSRRTATYVDKILKGAKPGDLPVEQPTKLELIINLKTAKTLGLAIPQPVLLRADELIQ